MDDQNSLAKVLTRIRDAVDDYLTRHPAPNMPEGPSTPVLPPEPERPRAPPVERRHSLARVIWLTVEQAVRYLGLPSRKALYQAIRRGHVPVHRTGRVLRFHRAELDAQLRQR